MCSISFVVILLLEMSGLFVHIVDGSISEKYELGWKQLTFSQLLDQGELVFVDNQLSCIFLAIGAFPFS